VTIHECSELPYGGTYRGLAGAMEHARSFSEVWSPYWDHSHPGARSLASDGAGTVTVRFRHHARSRASGRTLDEPQIGVYQVRDGLVIRAQMFHFQPQLLRRFLLEAEHCTTTTSPGRT